MSCTNCYNGCAEIVSDQCVRYTGISVPTLGIVTGDTLSKVEESLINFLVSTLNGTGITLSISEEIICDIVKKNLDCCEPITLPEIITALIKAVCEIETRLTAVEADFAALEGPYTVDCLSGVTSGSGTHAILQATIDKLCALEDAVSALALDVDTNYVKIDDLDTLIAAYLASIGASTKFYNRMVPFTVVEFYGNPAGKFDVSGAGIGDWEKIYLCNGNNGTPDKRGRVGVGATAGMGGGAMNPAVDPAVPGNPAYALLGTAGSNNVTLTANQIPSHTHTATVNDPGHKHTYNDVSGTFYERGNDGSKFLKFPVVTDTSISTTGISVTIGATGGGLGHPNYQPGLGCYYIMYIP